MSQSDTANEVVQITSSGPTMPKLTSENDAADEIVKNASDWQLSQNNSYHQLRKALNDRTAERDVMKCVHSWSPTRASLTALLQESVLGNCPDFWTRHL